MIKKSVDPLTDKTIVAAFLEADEGRSTFGERIALFLRCKDGELNLWIKWGNYLGSDRPTVTLRIGAAPAKDERWRLSADKTATFHPFPLRLPRVIQQLTAAGRFVAQVTPYNENPVTAVFDLTGIEEIAPQVLEPCSYN